MPKSLEELLDQLDQFYLLGGQVDDTGLVSRARELGMEATVELCCADLEWRWRMRSKKPLAERNKPATVTASFRRRSALPPTIVTSAFPCASDYQSLLSPWWLMPKCRSTLLETEWIARSVWGDQPRVEQFLKCIGSQSLTRESLLSTLEVLSPIEIRVCNSSTPAYQQLVPSRFTVGRQKVSEPPPPFWSVRDHRLVAWEINTMQVSREQLLVQRSRIHEIEITNLSSSRDLDIEGCRLGPRQAGHAALPFSCQINDTLITIRQVIT
jgi:hypothetical protein